MVAYKAETAMGSRMLKHWLDKPLININDINQRLDIIARFQKEFIICEEIRNALKNVYDLERLVGRIAYDNANGRDLLQLKRSLGEMPLIKSKLSEINDKYHLDLDLQFNTFTDLYDLLLRSID